MQRMRPWSVMVVVCGVCLFFALSCLTPGPERPVPCLAKESRSDFAFLLSLFST